MMNYLKIYNNIIDRARNRTIEGYCERHHIIPKCLGGSNERSNLVDLTAREHFVAHQLLVKIYPNNRGLLLAVQMMCVSSSGQVRNNKHYAWLKEALSKIPMSEETKQKLRECVKTDEHKEKIKEKRKLQVFSEESRKKMNAALLKHGKKFKKGNIPHNKDKSWDDEVKDKIRQKRKEQVMFPQTKYVCQHCKESVTKTNMTRWHGDLCSKQLFNYG